MPITKGIAQIEGGSSEIFLNETCHIGRVDIEEMERFELLVQESMNVDEGMHIRTVDKSQAVVPYGIINNETGGVVGRLDLYDPRRVADYYANEIPVWQVAARSYTWTGISFKRTFMQERSSVIGVSEYLQLLESNPWATNPYVANVLVLPQFRPPYKNGYGTALTCQSILQHQRNFDLPVDTVFWGLTDNPHMLQVARRMGGKLLAGYKKAGNGKRVLKPTFKHIHLSLLQTLPESKVYRDKKVEIFFCGDQGTQLVFIDDKLVAIKMLETIDATPYLSRGLAPAQSLLVINPELSSPTFSTLTYFLYDLQETPESALWENAFQMPKEAWTKALPLDGVDIANITKTPHKSRQAENNPLELKQGALFLIKPNQVPSES